MSDSDNAFARATAAGAGSDRIAAAAATAVAATAAAQHRWLMHDDAEAADADAERPTFGPRLHPAILAGLPWPPPVSAAALHDVVAQDAWPNVSNASVGSTGVASGGVGSVSNGHAIISNSNNSATTNNNTTNNNNNNNNNSSHAFANEPARELWRQSDDSGSNGNGGGAASQQSDNCFACWTNEVASRHASTSLRSTPQRRRRLIDDMDDHDRNDVWAELHVQVSWCCTLRVD